MRPTALRGLGIGLVLAFVLTAAPARAQHGGVQAGALIDVEGRYGAALLADALWLDGSVRVGMAVAAGALSNGAGERSNVLGLLGPELWFGRPETQGSYGSLRLGGFLASRKGGFFGGGWLGMAAGYRFSLGARAALRAGVEAQWLVGARRDLLLGPCLGLEL